MTEILAAPAGKSLLGFPCMEHKLLPFNYYVYRTIRNGCEEGTIPLTWHAVAIAGQVNVPDLIKA